jgi:hypothetical protein
VRRKPRWNAYSDANDTNDAMTARRRNRRNENGDPNILDARFNLAMIEGSVAMDVAESDDRGWTFVALPPTSLEGVVALHILTSTMPVAVS